MKVKTRYVCNECGYISSSWIGKCPECLSWNSFKEEIIENDKKRLPRENGSEKAIFHIDEIEIGEKSLLKFLSESLNIFFGNGIVNGSVILLAGEPGIGKSTFLLFLAKYLKDKKIYYFSGEESLSQIKSRIERTGDKLDIFISNLSNIDELILLCERDLPDIIFLDSIQTIYSNIIENSAGTISQIKYCASRIIEFSKKYNIPVIIIGHINKAGDIAGPKLIEHLVDVVLYFESDLKDNLRVLRSIKNRFGNTNEILLFEMADTGLTYIESITNYFIDMNEKEKESIGKCKSVIIEGRKFLIIEIEALVVPSNFVNPKRVVEGVDFARVNRIIAILNKHLNENLNNYDIYVNISRGIKTKDIGIDLAIAVAIYSSKHNFNIKNDVAFIGELSLTGRLNSVNKIEQRIKEAKKLGLSKIYVPKIEIEEDILFQIDRIDKNFINIFK
ncbi:MAG TPA: DNA repair protein RadA [Spirochaetota bacterium]|nr:DNA repair protein RadA [Spirochaetota bacterium]HOL56003.1 DNA repair protein RadA [Spirochaetota bacterium]HPP03445.1 DNA repair protein RadA [Spirochaetota bacterium]